MSDDEAETASEKKRRKREDADFLWHLIEGIQETAPTAVSEGALLRVGKMVTELREENASDSDDEAQSWDGESLSDAESPPTDEEDDDDDDDDDELAQFDDDEGVDGKLLDLEADAMQAQEYADYLDNISATALLNLAQHRPELRARDGRRAVEELQFRAIFAVPGTTTNEALACLKALCMAPVVFGVGSPEHGPYARMRVRLRRLDEAAARHRERVLAP